MPAGVAVARGSGLAGVGALEGRLQIALGEADAFGDAAEEGGEFLAAASCSCRRFLTHQGLVEFRLQFEGPRTEFAIAFAERGVGSRAVFPFFQPVERAV